MLVAVDVRDYWVADASLAAGRSNHAKRPLDDGLVVGVAVQIALGAEERAVMGDVADDGGPVLEELVAEPATGTIREALLVLVANHLGETMRAVIGEVAWLAGGGS